MPIQENDGRARAGNPDPESLMLPCGATFDENVGACSPEVAAGDSGPHFQVPIFKREYAVKSKRSRFHPASRKGLGNK
jgi:hypothetical protein